MGECYNIYIVLLFVPIILLVTHIFAICKTLIHVILSLLRINLHIANLDMDKLLKPMRFDCLPDDPSAPSQWTHWYKTFSNFLDSITPTTKKLDKLQILVNHISPAVYNYICDESNYDTAIKTLENTFLKTKNEIYARHILLCRRQAPNEDISQYLSHLKLLARDCNFKSLTASQIQNQNILDALVSGLSSNFIRQRLLEQTLDLNEAVNCALAIEQAQFNSEKIAPSINHSYQPLNAITNNSTSDSDNVTNVSSAVKFQETNFSQQKCYFCGDKRHPRINCPAKTSTCNKCGKNGHFAKVCRSKNVSNFSACINHDLHIATSSPNISQTAL